jgi:hypothetical protein
MESFSSSSTSSSDPQEAMILRAIVVSSSSTWQGQMISSHDRQAAFQVLKDFQNYQGRIPLCLKWILSQDNAVVVVATKLYACDQIQDFLKHKYSQLAEPERLQVRHAILSAAQNLCVLHTTTAAAAAAANYDGNPNSNTNNTAELRILSNKLASLLAAIMVRDFPQRWTTCIEDLFGRLWGENNNTLGVKMCLQVLKLVAEDCTDSDFNAKVSVTTTRYIYIYCIYIFFSYFFALLLVSNITLPIQISTKRRNDILIGLNEISSQFLPYLFRSLEQIVGLTQAKTQLHQMRGYLLQNQIPLNQMNPDQQSAYAAELKKVQTTSMMIVDTLSTLEIFCRSMPLEWILGAPPMDFSAALIHLMREPTNNIQLLALECLEQLCLRGKLKYQQWMQWIQELPNAIQQANQQMALEQEYKQLEAKVNGGTYEEDPLTVQFEFHRALSRMLSVVLSSHLAHIAVYKHILKQEGAEYHAFFNYLRLLVDMCHHPSGKVPAEQMNLWISLLRDPQLARSKILQPFVSELLNCYMSHMARIRWEDVEERRHPQIDLMDASWDDFDEYDTWLGDYRSKSSQLFKLLGNYAPDIAASTLCNRLKGILTAHGNGEPRDHVDPKSQQITQSSEGVRQLEGLIQPMENILFGLPSWSIVKPSDEGNGNNRAAIRAQAQASLSELANMIVNWNPTYLWLKFRRAQLLEALKHYWKHEPATLLQGIDSLLKYIGAPDEWATGEVEADGYKRISGETVGLRKKSSMALVTVARKVPHHLVQWLSQLGEAAQSLLSSTDLNSTNRMHLYEFLSSVATAVEDSTQRANFVATILSEAITTLKSPESQEAIASVEGFLSTVGVSQVVQYPASVTEISNVKAITARFQRLFSAINQLLSVAKRCHEAAKLRPNGGVPIQSIPQGTAANISFPDEGPVSLRDLSVDDPFVPLWPQILPDVLKVTDVILRLWRPEHQAVLLRDRIQRYALAISDDEAYLAKKTDNNDGGVFGEGGTAGSVISGTDRRDSNLAPRWSGWFNELRNTCFQILGLIAAQRVLFAPEMSEIYPRFVAVVTDPDNLRAMEHRHFTQYL